MSDAIEIQEERRAVEHFASLDPRNCRPEQWSRAYQQANLLATRLAKKTTEYRCHIDQQIKIAALMHPEPKERAVALRGLFLNLLPQPEGK